MVENTSENLHEVIIRYGCGEQYLYSITPATGMTVAETIRAIEEETLKVECHQCQIDRILEKLG